MPISAVSWKEKRHQCSRIFPYVNNDGFGGGGLGGGVSMGLGSKGGDWNDVYQGRWAMWEGRGVVWDVA